MIVLAALSGGCLALGLFILVHELFRRAPQPGTPPRRALGHGLLTTASARRAAVAAGVGLFVMLISGWPVAGIAAAAAVVFLPRLTTARTQQRRIAVLEGLDQWTRRIGDLLTAGHGLDDALEASAATAPAAIAGPVNGLARRLATGIGSEAALRAFAAELADPAADQIAAALIIATGARGGAVREVLNELADLLAENVAARRQVEADRAQHRTALRWITGFLIGYSVFALLDRSYSAPFGTVAGQVVMAAVASLYACGLWWLHRLGTTPEPGLFLAGPLSADEGGPHRGRL